MRLKMSWFNKEIAIQNFRSVGWISIAYFLLLLFTLPLSILMMLTGEDDNFANYYDDLISFNIEFQFMMLMIVPLLIGLFIFRYIQVKPMADFMHSLPIKRLRLFDHHFWMGYLLLFLPVILNAFFLVLLYFFSNHQGLIELKDIGDWLLVYFMYGSLIYTVTVFIGFITGISVVQAILTIVMLLFPTGIIVLIYSNLDLLLYGFSQAYAWDIRTSALSPITDMLDYYYYEVSWLRLIPYVLLCVIFYLLSKFLYLKRPIEAASQALAFPQLKPIFKFGVTFCFMLLGGMYFAEVQGQVGWIIFGYIIFAILGYFLSEMILQKNWRVWNAWRGFFTYAGLTTIILLIIVFDIFGYETKIPTGEEIEGVYVSEDGYSYFEENQFREDNKLTSKRSIEQVRKLHEALINDKQNQTINPNYHPDSKNIYLIYYLEDGSEVVREYFIQHSQQYNELLKPLFETQEYKEIQEPWMSLEKEKVDSISLNSPFISMELSDPIKMEAFMQKIKEDYQKRSYEEMQYRENNIYYAEFQINDEYYHANFSDQDEETITWIKENFPDFSLAAEDLLHLVILSENHSEEILWELDNWKEGTDYWILEETGHIETVLEANQSIDWEDNYTVGVYDKVNNGYLYTFQVNKEDMPALILEKMK
ncbi:hypothetical protein [Saliterribacillus persicus]|uniref:ABC-2 type transport system permease protein n=1 Tax=Saliterribacillus persicus TaxID=930114 RepID=A0A368XVF9_9BACI|nr:hypothetical protein [Saliterribacillus persicus]RCW71875.1 ABC-2 type transport system permease protein [Saliterribacillus persicus]